MAKSLSEHPVNASRPCSILAHRSRGCPVNSARMKDAQLIRSSDVNNPRPARGLIRR